MCKPCRDRLAKLKATKFQQTPVDMQNYSFDVGDIIEYVGAGTSPRKYPGEVTHKGYRFSGGIMQQKRIGFEAHEVNPSDVAGLLKRVVASKHIFQIVRNNPVVEAVPEPVTEVVKLADPVETFDVVSLETDAETEPVVVSVIESPFVGSETLAELTVKEIKAVWEAATEEQRKAYKKQYRTEEEEGKKRKSVLSLFE